MNTTDLEQPPTDEFDEIVDSKAAGGAPEKEETPPDELRQIVTELAATVKEQNKPKPAPQKELTQAEKDELWGVYNPEKANPDFFKKWMRLQADMDPTEAQTTIAERKQLFAEMQQGFMRQSATTTRNMIQIELQKLKDELAPVHEFVGQSRARDLKSRFDTAYPVLADAKYGKAVSYVAKTLADREFASEDDYFKVLAESTAEVLKTANPEFDLGAVPQTKTKPGQSPRLPRTSAGGTGGAGGGTGTPTGKGRADATAEFADED